MRDFASDLRLRESELDSLRIAFKEDLATKERDKSALKLKLEEATSRLSAGEAEVSRLRDDFEQRINEYEDTLNAKIRDNQGLAEKLRAAEARIEDLEKEASRQKAASVSQTRIKMLNPTVIQKPTG